MEYFETLSCPLCSELKYQVLRKGQYGTGLSREKLLEIYKSSSDQQLLDPLVKCLGCGLVYLNPRVQSDIIMESYSSAKDEKFIGQNPWRIKTFKKSLRNIIKKFNFRPEGNKKVLDIGCAGGAFPKAASDLGFSILGIEPSRWLCDYARKTYQVEIREGILQDHSFPNQSFDMVTLWDVIEHLTDPQAVLSQISAMMKRDGLLVVNFPDYDSLVAKLLKDRWPFLLSVHLIYFTPQTISQILGKWGFTVLEIKRHWQSLQIGYILERAAYYFPLLKYLKRTVDFLNLSHLPLVYYLGQKQVVAVKTDGLANID